MSGRSVWITGGRGFIGRALARTLSDGGDVVRGVGHGDWAVVDAAAAGVTDWVAADVSATGLDALLQKAGAPPDAVIHLAGGASVGRAEADADEDFRRTVTSTESLLAWLDHHAPNTRLVAVSSAAVYGEAGPDPIAEDAPIQPVSAYGRHKARMEVACLSAAGAKRPVAIARLFSVYGVNLEKQLLWDIAQRLAGGAETLSLGGSGRELRDFTSVDDASFALVRLIDQATPGGLITNVATGRALSVRDVAGLAVAAWPSPADVTFSGATRAGDPFSLVADTRRAAALGIACATPAESGIAAYMAWARAELEHQS